MTDLYAILGVARDATAEQIKKAFRSKAKATHPDHGGDPAMFSQVALAHDVLSDPDSRARYDRDGTVEGAQVGELDRAALGIIEQMMSQTLGQVPEDGAIYNNVVEKFREALAQSKRDLEREIDNSARMVARLAKFASRFSVTDGKNNILAKMVEYKIDQHNKRGDGLRQALAHHDRAIEILKDFSFTADAETIPTVRQTAGWGNPMGPMGMFR